MPGKIKGKVIFRATNNFTKEKGHPPSIDTTDQSKYGGYFENDFREQFIFIYDYETGTGTLWLSKKGWENLFPVVEGKAKNAGLGQAEKTWLKACWNAAVTRQRRREYHQRLLAGLEEQPDDPIVPSYEEVFARMEHLYDFLSQTDVAPDCSKFEFAHGWARLHQLTARLEEKYTHRQPDQSS